MFPIQNGIYNNTNYIVKNVKHDPCNTRIRGNVKVKNLFIFILATDIIF